MQLSHSLNIRQDLRQQLDHKQRAELRNMLLLLLELKSPFDEVAVKGIPGIIAANKILEREQVPGLLIGGLAQAAWRGHGEKRLEQHKDVDVAVLSDTFRPQRKFEGGIDWWTRTGGEIEIESTAGSYVKDDLKWFTNGNNVTLGFSLRAPENLKPGLYIPDSYFVKEMRIAEVLSRVDASVSVDPDALSVFSDRLAKLLNRELCKPLQSIFKDRQLFLVDIAPVGSPGTRRLASDVIELVPFDLSIMRGIVNGPSQTGDTSQLSLPARENFPIK